MIKDKSEASLSILYEIQGIQPYDRIPGYVGILLVPSEALDIKKKPKPQIHTGFGMMEVGREDMPEQMKEFLEKLMGQRPGADEDRNIIVIRDKEVFQNSGWKYGDQIKVTFDKIVMDDEKEHGT